jgi:hypothetical protein
MRATQKSLYELYADYDDERLLRILTVERAMYRPEALSAAEKVLMQRDVSPPLEPAPPPAFTAQPMTTGGRARPKSPYRPIDFGVDVLLFSFLYSTTRAMDVGSVLPESLLVDGAVRLLFIISLTVGVMYLRNGWRTKEW